MSDRKIPFLDLQKTHREIRSEIDEAIAAAIAHGKFIKGPEVDRFELEWANYCGTAHCVGTSNGTSALHAALSALGVGPGHEVICPSHTFIATVESILHCGAIPVFADIEEDSLNMNMEHAASLVTDRTRAIVPVHLYGTPVNWDELSRITVGRNIALVEDAAQAHGAFWKGKKTGSLGNTASFSFFPGKNLGAFGDAGAVTTNDPEAAAFIQRFVNHGREEKFISGEVGTNYRLDTLQAAILSVKLRHLDDWLARRRQVAAKYREILSAEPFASIPVLFQEIPEGAVSAYHLFVVRLPDHDRDRVRAVLGGLGVGTGIHYPVPCHLQPAMQYFAGGEGSLPVTERVCAEILSLPVCPTMNEDDAEEVCERLLEAISKSKVLSS